MKIYLIADIEGTCNFTHIEEGEQGGSLYPYFCKQMTREVSSACIGALKMGAKDILVHDAHGCSRNIVPDMLPNRVRLMRQAGGDPLAMLSGADKEDFDAVFMTGFHAPAGSNGSPVSHTFNRKTSKILLNGQILSEFMYDAYSASYLGLPVPFVSGDKKVCEIAKELIPNITAVQTVEGIGAGTISMHPDKAVQKIEEGVEKALSGDWKSCKAVLPEKFTLTICYRNHQDAYYNSFYPGVKQIDDTTIEFSTDNWFEILRAIHYVLK
jgi:D-amino peptidase